MQHVIMNMHMCNCAIFTTLKTKGLTVSHSRKAAHPLAPQAAISCVRIGATGCHYSVMPDAMAVPPLTPQAGFAPDLLVDASGGHVAAPRKLPLVLCDASGCRVAREEVVLCDASGCRVARRWLVSSTMSFCIALPTSMLVVDSQVI